MRRINLHCVTAALSVLLAVAGAEAGTAPTGSYTATMSGTASTSSATSGHGAARGRRSSEATTGTAVSIRIDSYSSEAELDALAAAQGDPAKFLDVLAAYDHGSVSIGGQSFPVNAVHSSSAGAAGNVIVLLTARPLTSSQTGRRGRSVSGTSGGYIRLTVDAAGSGDGVLYTSTQVTVETDGSFSSRGGGSTATPLDNVQRG